MRQFSRLPTLHLDNRVARRPTPHPLKVGVTTRVSPLKFVAAAGVAAQHSPRQLPTSPRSIPNYLTPSAPPYSSNHDRASPGGQPRATPRRPALARRRIGMGLLSRHGGSSARRDAVRPGTRLARVLRPARGSQAGPCLTFAPGRGGLPGGATYHSAASTRTGASIRRRVSTSDLTTPMITRSSACRCMGRTSSQTRSSRRCVVWCARLCGPGDGARQDAHRHVLAWPGLERGSATKTAGARAGCALSVLSLRARRKITRH